MSREKLTTETTVTYTSGVPINYDKFTFQSAFDILVATPKARPKVYRTLLTGVPVGDCNLEIGDKITVFSGEDLAKLPISTFLVAREGLEVTSDKCIECLANTLCLLFTEAELAVEQTEKA